MDGIHHSRVFIVLGKVRSPFTATQPNSLTTALNARYQIYKLSLVSMSKRSQLVMKSSEKLSRLSMSDRQGLSLAMRTIALPIFLI
ncbi:hypothetical protein [Nostoc sp. FACHB-888]|uniref:hypothetical protein n=1 Tax=Nostoc sp. FACHB-888 TaxID=2692842 RepID=UPI00168524AC|nr:hypothetical protein [Nostoc sp. FACHB-888]MBD2246139.1 hypothetical protein [Nostoc sp. FACHB-888]